MGLEFDCDLRYLCLTICMDQCLDADDGLITHATMVVRLQPESLKMKSHFFLLVGLLMVEVAAAQDNPTILKKAIEYQDVYVTETPARIEFLQRTLQKGADKKAPRELRIEYERFQRSSRNVRGAILMEIKMRQKMAADVAENKDVAIPMLFLNEKFVKEVEPGDWGIVELSATIESSVDSTKFYGTVDTSNPKTLSLEGWNYTDMEKVKIDRHRDAIREPSLRLGDSHIEVNGVELHGVAEFAGKKAVRNSFGSNIGELTQVPIIKKVADVDKLKAAVIKARASKKD